jgi:hypothetical protein
MKKIAVVMLIFVCFSANAQTDSNDLIRAILNQHRNNLNEERQEILSIDDLIGTFWVIDNPENDHGIDGVYYNVGYIFLGNNVLLVVNVMAYENSEQYNDIFKYHYSILSLSYSTYYKLLYDRHNINNKILISEDFYCYLDDTYLYFGNENDGYEKYTLEDRFSIYD